MTGVAFVDVETTGLDPDRHEIWEVALITPFFFDAEGDDAEGDDAEVEWDEQVWQLPVDLSRADTIALNIGRFHDRRLPATSLVDLGTFAAEFVEATRGLHLAGAVISFDVDRLWRLLRANGQCPMWHYHVIDVEALAAGYLAGCRAEGPSHRPPWSSNDLSGAVGVEPDDFDRHSALGDARWAKAIYEAVLGR